MLHSIIHAKTVIKRVIDAKAISPVPPFMSIHVKNVTRQHLRSSHSMTPLATQRLMERFLASSPQPITSPISRNYGRATRLRPRNFVVGTLQPENTKRPPLTDPKATPAAAIPTCTVPRGRPSPANPTLPPQGSRQERQHRTGAHWSWLPIAIIAPNSNLSSMRRSGLPYEHPMPTFLCNKNAF